MELQDFWLRVWGFGVRMAVEGLRFRFVVREGGGRGQYV